ncbi:Nucleotide binding protein PINc [Ignicoccus islandicus DSM 13165]|uniref:Nucleotide binding protein PINc n=1 Tax=Ignicoccus islandicus DSM 13165 TaxID=940295 RepID=A0A0U3E0S6_9CREN|nr:hypothetical protein [Ignicoccus islandicus]ALU11515.1 Nucleotide binding protein PINc [Ignicoccus islandicus DSM 13165]
MLKPKGNKFVHDTGSLLAGTPSLLIGENYTTPLNLKEVRDKESKNFLSIYIEKLKVVEPEAKFLRIVKEKSEELGENLSDADVAVLALALQLRATLLSDDYGVLNVASELGIPWKTVRTKGISERRKWVWYCPNCGRTFERHLRECPACGSPLRRRSISFGGPRDR